MLTITRARPLASLFDEALRTWDWGFHNGGRLTTWTPPVDISESANDLRLQAELPGLKPEDVKLSVEANVLTISGTKQQESEENSERVYRYERTYGSFTRTFTLPTSIDAAGIKATYEHGVLTVVLPKVEKAKPRQIPVQVSKN